MANRSYAVTVYVQHGQAARPAQHVAQQVAPGQARDHAAARWTPEQEAAMGLVGVVGIVTCAVCVLLFIKLVRWTFGGGGRREAV